MTKCNLRDKIKVIILKISTITNATNDIELSKALHTNPNTFSSWKNTTKLIPIETLIVFCDEYNISLDWLLRSDNISNEFSDNDNIIKIPYFENINSYNFLNKNIKDMTKDYICQHIKSIKSKDVKDIFAIYMNDNQLPSTAPKGSTIIMNKKIEIMPYPETYLVEIEGRLFFKKVYMRIDSKYCLFSENVCVKEDIVHPNDLKIIAKVVGVLKWEN